MDVAELRTVVTGGARGIGAATARLLAEGRARVLATDVLDAEGEALVREIGSGALYRRLDVTGPDDCQEAVDLAERSFGSVNALFNNAGILAWGSVPTARPRSSGASATLTSWAPSSASAPSCGPCVAQMAGFLFTEATYSTGSEFVVDGGAVTGQVLPLPRD